MLHMELCSCSSTILGQQRCTDRCSWVPCSLQKGFSCKCYSLALLDSNQIWEQLGIAALLSAEFPVLALPHPPANPKRQAPGMSELSQPLDVLHVGSPTGNPSSFALHQLHLRKSELGKLRTKRFSFCILINIYISRNSY